MLEEWLGTWARHHGLASPRVQLLPHRAGSELLELVIQGGADERLANVVFASMQDRRGHTILLVRDQNTFDVALRRKRLMTLVQLFLVHRYQADSVHYVTPSDDNHHQTARMRELGIFRAVNTEVGQIIVADVDPACVARLIADPMELDRLITRAA